MAQRLFTSSTRSTAAKQKDERRGGAVAGAAVKRKEERKGSFKTSGLQKSLQEIHKPKVKQSDLYYLLFEFVFVGAPSKEPRGWANAETRRNILLSEHQETGS